MKALPLWQPWATLVAIGAKRVETRHWHAPAGILSERIAIHATKGGLSKRDERDLLDQPEFDKALRLDLLDRDCPYGHCAVAAELLPRGAVIATAVLARCERMTPQSIAAVKRNAPREYAFGDWRPGRYAWVLEDVQELDEVVPFRGSQGIFDVPDELLGHDARQGALL